MTINHDLQKRLLVKDDGGVRMSGVLTLVNLFVVIVMAIVVGWVAKMDATVTSHGQEIAVLRTNQANVLAIMPRIEETLNSLDKKLSIHEATTEKLLQSKARER